MSKWISSFLIALIFLGSQLVVVKLLSGYWRIQPPDILTSNQETTYIGAVLITWSVIMYLLASGKQ